MEGPMDVYTMKEFLEVLSIQEQTVFLDIKRRQRAAAAGSSASAVCSLEDMLDMMALQQKKATFEKKRQERLARLDIPRPTVMELFGILHYSDTPTPPYSPVEGDAVDAPTSSPPATFTVGESSGSRGGEGRGPEEVEEEARRTDNQEDGPRAGGESNGRNVGGGSSS